MTSIRSEVIHDHARPDYVIFPLHLHYQRPLKPIKYLIIPQFRLNFSVAVNQNKIRYSYTGIHCLFFLQFLFNSFLLDDGIFYTSIQYSEFNRSALINDDHRKSVILRKDSISP